eukprot:3946015-Amphidinium_carterae.1
MGRKLSMAEDGLKIVDLVDKFASRLSLGQPLPHPGCIGVGDKLADKEETTMQTKNSSLLLTVIILACKAC